MVRSESLKTNRRLSGAKQMLRETYPLLRLRAASSASALQSAASVAGLLDRAEAGAVPAGATVVLTVTGHGLKDPQWALKAADGSEVQPTSVAVDTAEIAEVLGLAQRPADATASA